MNENNPIIKVRHLNIAFGPKVVLSDVDFDVFQGETLADI